MTFRTTLFVALSFTLIAGTSMAAPLTYTLPEETAHLKDAAGVDVVQNNCSACHSSEYIATQPSGKGEKFWTAEVTKMIKVYGASIDEADVGKIAAYLAANY